MSPQKETFGFPCPNCKTELQVEKAQVGQQRPCPKCGATVLPFLPSEGGEEGEAYAINAPPTEPQFTGPKIRVGRRATEGVILDPQKEEPIFHSGIADGLIPEPQRSRLPAYPSLGDLLSFFRYHPGINCWLLISILSFIFFFTSTSYVGMIRHFEIEGFESIVGLMITVFCLFMMVFSLIPLSVFLLAVLYDTAAGNQTIENWPEINFRNWFFEMFFLLIPLLLPLAVGAIFRQLTGLGFWYVFGVIAAMVWLVFPISLLSVLDKRMPLYLFSPSVVGTMRRSRKAWLAFYLASAGLVFIIGVIGWGLDRLGLATFLLEAPLCGFAAIYYVRLLGRLAWICSNESGEEQEDEGKGMLKTLAVPPPICRPPVKSFR